MSNVSIGVLWRGDASEPPPPESTRLHLIFEELIARGAAAEPVVYSEEREGQVGERLRQMDGVLVWVNPIQNGRDRSQLDRLLRDVAAQGVFVSAHPDTILAMGTKEVLVRTRDLPCGSDARLYRSIDELRQELPKALRSGPRVLKQNRGNGGDGVWKIERVDELSMRVQHALRGAQVETMRLADVVERFRPYFAADGCMIDQAYAARLGEGMIRAYLVADRVAGFGHQFVTALMPPPQGEAAPPDPPPRLYYGADRSEFRALKKKLETGWVAAMQEALGITQEQLPVIWDADFLLGPQDTSGEDTYFLCEINVSSVFPIPDESVPPLADEAVARAIAAKRLRAG